MWQPLPLMRTAMAQLVSPMRKSPPSTVHQAPRQAAHPPRNHFINLHHRQVPSRIIQALLRCRCEVRAGSRGLQNSQSASSRAVCCMLQGAMPASRSSALGEVAIMRSTA